MRKFSYLVISVVFCCTADSLYGQNQDETKEALAIGRKLAEVAIDSARRVEGRPGRSGLLIAEGDSWFDYPKSDVLKELRRQYGYDILSTARAGDTLENIVYGEDSLPELAAQFELLQRKNLVPVGILLSAGGNDIAGPEITMLLNHRISNRPPLDPKVVGEVLHHRIKAALLSLVSAVDSLRMEYFHKPIPILIHGYDCPVPDGRGFLGGFWFLPGPWLRPALERKGMIPDDGNLGHPTALMCDLIKEYNRMLSTLPAASGVANLKYVSVVGTLPNSSNNYKDSWRDEMHATQAGFRKVAEKFHNEIKGGG